MVRLKRHAAARRVGSPHTRGDGPASTWFFIHPHQVLPTRVGMVPSFVTLRGPAEVLPTHVGMSYCVAWMS